MPPTPEQQNSVPPVVPIQSAPPPVSVPPSTPSPAIKAVRIFLLVLIVIGLGLITAQSLWVPMLVNALVPIPVVPVVTNPTGQQRQALLNIDLQGEQQNTNATTTPNGITSTHANGYSIDIPSSFVYSNPKPNYETWHSSNSDQLIIVQWEPYSPGSYSYIKSTEDAQFQVNELAKTRPAMASYTVSYPAVVGSASSTLFEKAINPGSHGMYLFVIGNGNIYEVNGLSETANADAPVKQIIDSFALTQ